MSSIPPEIYERVHELLLAIVNASEAGDDVLDESLRETLRAFYEEQATRGFSHPFLTEAVADFTEDAFEAANLYELAIEQAAAFSDETTHTKMICLAERLMELGRKEQAEAFLREGRMEALRLDDTFWTEEANELLAELDGEGK